MRTVTATRYVTPLREGGSVPAIVEAEDSGLYVVKFRGAGQGIKALIAEVVAGELARAAGLAVPELVLVEFSEALSRNERDQEIRELLQRSVGLNVGLDYLPGSVTFEPVAGPAPGPEEASAIVWFDALVANIDREARNPNLLWWHRRLWLIDHGAALYFHHAWDQAKSGRTCSFPGVARHVLLPWATRLEAEGARLAARLDRGALEAVLAQVPDAWLSGEPSLPTPASHRLAYLDWLQRRLAAASTFIEEAERARAQLV